MAHAGGVHRRQGVADEQRVRHRHVHRGRALRQRAARRRGQRAARAGHVIQQHHGAAGNAGIAQRHVHVAITMPLLVADRVVQALRQRGGAHPLARFFVGRQQQCARHLPRDVGAKQQRGGQGHAAAAGHDLVQRGHAVQVRVDRDHGVEGAGQQPPQVALADHLARCEGHVLAHVGQVGADQREVRGAEFARAGGGQQQRQQLLVGLLQAAQEHRAWRQLGRQSQPRLAVRKAVLAHPRQRHAQGSRQRAGQRAFILPGQQHGQAFS